jgi:putative SOS response-associated peptidase YedK
MCGRYSFAPDLEIVNEHYNITVKDGDISPNYNCAPSQSLPVITNDNPGEIKFFRWGLIPFWAKDKTIGNKLINARGETIAEKASFKNAFRHRRCLVPADAFYEWKKSNTDKKKIPFRIYLPDQPVFSMAGIWESWKNPQGEVLNTFSIITTKPNVLMAEIHDRMPVILPISAEQMWLQSTDERELTGLLKPFPSKAMSAYRISDLVNSPRNNSAKIIAPEELPDLFQ